MIVNQGGGFVGGSVRACAVHLDNVFIGNRALFKSHEPAWATNDDAPVPYEQCVNGTTFKTEHVWTGGVHVRDVESVDAHSLDQEVPRPPKASATQPPSARDELILARFSDGSRITTSELGFDYD